MELAAEGNEITSEVADALMSVAENIRNRFGASLVNSPIGGYPVGYYKFYQTDAPLVLPEPGLPVNQHSRDNEYVEIQSKEIIKPIDYKN